MVNQGPGAVEETFDLIDEAGKWKRMGSALALVEPSQDWLDARAAEAEAAAQAAALVPDFNAAMLAAFVALETLEADSADDLLAATPSFGIAMTQQNGPLAWQRLTNALAKGKITQGQHDAIAGAMQTNNIPDGQG